MNEERKEPKTIDELKAAITELEIELSEGRYKTVTFETVEGDADNDASWWAETAIGSGVRDIIYVGIKGLEAYYQDLVDFKDDDRREPLDLGPLVAKYRK